MAVTAITPVALGTTAAFSELTFTEATTAADGYVIDYSGEDGKTLLIFHNGDDDTAATVTINKGNGLQGVADLASGNIPFGDYYAVVLDSGAYKNVSGTNKGKVVAIPSATTLAIAAVVLP